MWTTLAPWTCSYSGVHTLAFSKGHGKVICFLFPAVWPYSPRCVTFSLYVLSPIALSWTVRWCILSGYWVALKYVMGLREFWCLAFLQGRTLSFWSSWSQTICSFSSLLSNVVISHNPWLLVWKGLCNRRRNIFKQIISHLFSYYVKSYEPLTLFVL